MADPAQRTDTMQDPLNRATIDQSLRVPVLFFFTAGMFWLFVASVLGLISSMKLHNPAFLGECSGLTYGRAFPAHQSAMIYGWVMQAGLGVSLWVMARLCRVPIKFTGLTLVVGHVWNLAVAIGVTAILFGYGTSIEWLDFPRFLWPVFLICYALIAGIIVMTFRARADGPVYISQWYLLAASLWFPWIYATANLLIHRFTSAAVIGTAINAWFVSTLMILWMVPVALACSYYFIPKIVGRRVYSYQIALAGFWMIAILGGWTGIQAYMGGPLPAWMPAVSGAATIFLLVPAIAIGINHHKTVNHARQHIASSPTLRFTSFGAFMFNFFIAAGALLCLYSIGRRTQFSLAETSHQVLGIYCFFTMIMFGAMYFIIPRLVKCEWRSGGWIRFHFWFSAYGSVCMAVSLFVGGFDQGSSMLNPISTMQDGVLTASSFAVGRSVGWLLIMIGNFVFFFHVLLMVLRLGKRSTEPTLIHQPDHNVSEGAKA